MVVRKEFQKVIVFQYFRFRLRMFTIVARCCSWATVSKVMCVEESQNRDRRPRKCLWEMAGQSWRKPRGADRILWVPSIPLFSKNPEKKIPSVSRFRVSHKKEDSTLIRGNGKLSCLMVEKPSGSVSPFAISYLRTICLLNRQVLVRLK